MILDPEDRLAAALDELDIGDQTATAVADLLYALGDLLAEHAAHRRRRPPASHRDETNPPRAAINTHQLDLFAADALDPF